MKRKTTGRKSAAKRQRRNGRKISVWLAVAIVLLVAVFFLLDYFYGPFLPFFDWRKSPSTLDGATYSETEIKEQDLSVHFLELGTKHTGDCVLIKSGNTEVLIDAGAKTASIPTLKSYVDRYCEDGILEYVVVTHAHEDHYAGFATGASTQSIFDLYDCRTVITFAQTTSGKTEQTMYKNFERELADEVAAGAKRYTAAECINGENGAQREYDLGGGATLEILDSYYYYNVSSTENDHSVCCMLHKSTGTQTKHYLFTGDLEKKGEEYLVQLNDLPKVELYKAGHHGSKTSSNDVLMSVVQPKIVCVCCCAGSSEYTDVSANQFPTQEFIDRVAPYTQAVYVTTLCIDYDAGSYESMNGNIAVCCSAAGETKLYCSGNTTPLKDTAWFKKNRNRPAAWS